ncbi:MAG: hypothetical protein HKN92_05885 [Chitinophagales bacterium]|nr:hypothetical protein [Chitinophagales bacterium]
MKKLELAPLGFLILLIGGSLYLSFLGAFDLTFVEIHAAELSREMLITNDLSTPRIAFEPVWEDPPFFNWVQTLSYKYFGVNEFAVRLPSAISGILILLICFSIGSSLFSKTFAWIWALFMASTAISFIFFRSGNPAAVMALMVFLSTYFAVRLFFDFEFQAKKISKRHRFIALTLSSFFGGLAVLTIGPEALILIIVPLLFLNFYNKGGSTISFNEFLIWLFLVLSIAGSWYGYMMYEQGIVSFEHWIDYYIKEYSFSIRSIQTLHLQLFALIILGFPSIIFIWDALKRDPVETKEQVIFINFMYALLATSVVFVIFTGGRKPEYLSLSIFPISFLAAVFFFDLIKGKRKWKKYHTLQLVIILSSFIISFSIVELNDFVIGVRHINWHLLLAILLVMVIFTGIFISRKSWLLSFYALVGSGIVVSFASWVLIFHIDGVSEREVKNFIKENSGQDFLIKSCMEEEVSHLFYMDLDSVELQLMNRKFEDISFKGARYIYGRKLEECMLDEYTFKKLPSNEGYHFFRIDD